MKITGQFLKEKRESKGISISEVALATKINNRTIVAMEEGNVESLPPKTFLRGFVRSYASFLDLDVEQVLNGFYEEMGTTKPKTSAPEGVNSPALPPVSPRANRTPQPDADEAINPTTSIGVKIGAVAAILLLVVLIVFFKNKMESYQKEAVVDGVPPNLDTLPSATPGLSATPLSSATPSESPTPGSGEGAGTLGAAGTLPIATPMSSETVKADLVRTTPVSAVAATSTPKPTPTATPVPTPTPTPSATPKPAPTATPGEVEKLGEKPVEKNPKSGTEAVAGAVAAAATPKPSPSPKPTPKPGRVQEVILEALDSVDVEVQADNEPVKKIHLSADQVQSIKSRRKVILKFSDGGAVNLIVNGVDRSVPGELGKPLRLELP